MYKILIVDDEKIERNGIRFLLKQNNIDFEISEAVNGVEALRMVKNEDFDILLTDVKMPFMDGLELIQNIVKLNKNIKSVIFSGCNEFDYARQAIKLGVQNYILKPVDPREFTTTIKKVISELEEEKYDDEIKHKSIQYLNEHALLMVLNGVDISKVQSGNKGIVIKDYLSKYKRIMLIEFNHDFFGRNEIEFKQNLLFKKYGVTQYLNLNQQQAVLIFDSDKLEFEYIANDIYKIIKNDYSEECYIAISSPIKSIEDIYAAMEEMDILLENKFYHPEIHVFYEGMQQDSGSIIQFDDDTLMKQMKQDVKMKDIISLKEHFERFCSKYRNKNEYSQIYIKFLFSNLLKDIYSHVDGLGEKDLNAEIEKLYMASDFRIITDIVQNGIDKIEKSSDANIDVEHKEVEIVKKYIYDHYGEELSVDMLAKIVYLAPSYLSSIFKKETNQNLSKFIKAYRMKKAKEKLEESMAKIVDISVECGYPNVSYFVSSFRDYFGVSPQKFRENGGEGIDEE